MATPEPEVLPAGVIPDEDIRGSDEQEHARLVAELERKMAQIDGMSGIPDSLKRKLKAEAAGAIMNSLGPASEDDPPWKHQARQEAADRWRGSIDALEGFPDNLVEDLFDQVDASIAPTTKGEYPPGYLRNLELIDWLAGEVPSAEDLTYEAPTYGETALGLPGRSEAAQAQANPYARDAQQKTIERYRDQLQDRGIGAEDVAALTRIQRGAQDTRQRGEQAIRQQLASRGMTTGGSRIAQDLALANQIRQSSTEKEGDVTRGYGDRGTQAARSIGQYGEGMADQTFREQFETARATDELRRKNAAALQRRGEDVRGFETRAALQAAQAPYQSHGLAQLPARLMLDTYKSEAPVRRSERTLADWVSRQNEARGRGASPWDYVRGAGQVGIGIATGNPGLVAAGVADTAGSYEKDANKQKPIKPSPFWTYGER